MPRIVLSVQLQSERTVVEVGALLAISVDDYVCTVGVREVVQIHRHRAFRIARTTRLELPTLASLFYNEVSFAMPQLGRNVAVTLSINVAVILTHYVGWVGYGSD